MKSSDNHNPENKFEHFLELPEDVQSEVIAKLSIQDFIFLLTTNKEMQALLTAGKWQQHWKNQVESHFPCKNKFILPCIEESNPSCSINILKYDPVPSLPWYRVYQELEQLECGQLAEETRNWFYSVRKDPTILDAMDDEQLYQKLIDFSQSRYAFYGPDGFAETDSFGVSPLLLWANFKDDQKLLNRIYHLYSEYSNSKEVDKLSLALVCQQPSKIVHEILQNVQTAELDEREYNSLLSLAIVCYKEPEMIFILLENSPAQISGIELAFREALILGDEKIIRAFLDTDIVDYLKEILHDDYLSSMMMLAIFGHENLIKVLEEFDFQVAAEATFATAVMCKEYEKAKSLLRMPGYQLSDSDFKLAKNLVKSSFWDNNSDFNNIIKKLKHYRKSAREGDHSGFGMFQKNEETLMTVNYLIALFKDAKMSADAKSGKKVEIKVPYNGMILEKNLAYIAENVFPKVPAFKNIVKFLVSKNLDQSFNNSKVPGASPLATK